MIVYCDLDETLCSLPVGSRRYGEATPIRENIQKVNKLYDAGHTIVIWTARGRTTGIEWRAVTEYQLKKWGVKYHSLSFDKPVFDMLIDDKAGNINDLCL